MNKHSVLDQLAKSGFEAKQLKQSIARSVVWSRDASHFQIQPQSTLRAKSIEDISKILAAANETGTPVTFRSGGSSLSGQTLGSGLVVDTRSGFQKIIEITDNQVIAQPGVTLSRLNGHLLSVGKKVGPDPASLVASTLGGAVSNNSSGMTCGVFYNSYETILGAKIVFPDGYVLDTSAVDADQQLRIARPDLVRLLESKRDQIRQNPEMVRQITRLFSLKNTMGYGLNAFLDHDTPVEILTRLMVGSEGTLGFMGEITMGLVPLKSLKATNLLVFESLDQANQTLMEIIGHKPAAIELMDRTSLAALDGQGLLPKELKSRITDQTAAVLVEFESDDQESLDAAVARFTSKFSKAVVFGGVTDPKLRNQLWVMRKNLYAIVAKARPQGTTALLEDVAVPPEKLTSACQSLAALCEKHGYGKPVIFGHVRDGNIHFMISDDFSEPKRIKAFELFTKDMVDLILDLGGNLKAEHGTGRAMAPFVEAQFGSDLYQIIREIKHGFDPAGIMNPGVIIASSETEYLENLKSVNLVDEIVDSCVECGYCESSCPSTGLTLTPRERIVAFRELEKQDPAAKKQLAKELHYQADQTCATDGMCAVNCPVGINTGTFVKEIRAKNQSQLSERAGLAMQASWGQIATVAGVGLRIANRLPFLAKNAANLLAVVAPRGTTPKWDKHVVGAGFRRGKLHSVSGGTFSYLPSCMNEIFGDTAIPEVLEIARANGIAVSIPENLNDFCCGTPFSSKGLTKAYGKQQSHNKKLMSQLAGSRLIIDGSSCHQTLSGQGDESILELTEFVAAELLGVPIKTKHDKIVLHPTCSGVATGSNSAMEIIAHHIATEVVIPVDWKCCGFAGDRGLLVPELTENATKLEAEELKDSGGLLVSNNQPCQVGMSGATNKTYVSILEAWLRSVS
jgi:D-lactate dehydrogenase